VTRVPDVDPADEIDDIDDSDDSDDLPGADIVRASTATTAAFVVAAVGATAFPDALGVPVAVFDVVLFVVGTVIFVLAMLQGLDRSRTEQVEIGALFFLTGATAPRAVKVRLLGCVVLQVVVALVSSSIRVYTEVAFGILVPMLGLGLAGRWGAKHGAFAKKPA
jgi:hypothetical protein